MLLQDLIRDGEAEAGTVILCCKERIEDFVQIFRQYTLSLVLNFNVYLLLPRLRFDRDFTSVWLHGMDGIDRDV